MSRCRRESGSVYLSSPRPSYRHKEERCRCRSDSGSDIDALYRPSCFTQPRQTSLARSLDALLLIAFPVSITEFISSHLYIVAVGTRTLRSPLSLEVSALSGVAIAALHVQPKWCSVPAPTRRNTSRSPRTSSPRRYTSTTQRCCRGQTVLLLSTRT